MTDPAASRREFLQSTSAAAVAVTAAPFFVHAQDKSGLKAPVLGEGRCTFEVVSHHWGELPAHIRWGDTHGVTIDSAGLIYIKHRSHEPPDQPMDAIAVFEPSGKFVRSFGKEYHGGGHGIDLRREGNEEFLYLCTVAPHRTVTKTTLTGERVWQMQFPPECGKYEDLSKFSPTNVAFAPDGGFWVADGYGSNLIHQYDRSAKYVRTFGGTGEEPGEFKTPHGLWFDDRPGRTPLLVVADRANARLQYFNMEGQPVSITKGVSFPAHFDTRGEELLIPDLHARVTILDKNNEVLVHLGYDENWTREVLEGFKMRTEPSRWEPGRFVHPHDACYDKDGNLFVVEWAPTGRVSFLRRVG